LNTNLYLLNSESNQVQLLFNDWVNNDNILTSVQFSNKSDNLLAVGMNDSKIHIWDINKNIIIR